MADRARERQHVADLDVLADGARLLGSFDEPATGRPDHGLAGREQVRVLAERGGERAHQAALHRAERDVHAKPFGERLAGLGVGLEESIALGAQARDLLAVDRLEERHPGREVPVQRSAADPRVAGDVIEGRVGAVLGDRGAGGVEQALDVALGIGAEGFGWLGGLVGRRALRVHWFVPLSGPSAKRGNSPLDETETASV